MLLAEAYLIVCDSLSGFTLIHSWMAVTPILGRESAEGGGSAWSPAIQRMLGRMTDLSDAGDPAGFPFLLSLSTGPRDCCPEKAHLEKVL